MNESASKTTGRSVQDLGCEISPIDLKGTETVRLGIFGAVQKCYLWGMTVAKKTIKKRNDSKDDCDIQNFLKEIEIHRFLSYLQESNHPNICKYIGHSDLSLSAKYSLFMILEWVEYGTLQEYLKENDITRKVFCEISKGIVNGMIFIHSNNVIHCDLRTANILLHDSGLHYHPKITDFGCAKHCDDEGIAKEVSTSFPLEWASPEFLKTSKSSKFSDIWAFGVCIYEMINSGCKPFEEYSTQELKSNIIHFGNQLSLESFLFPEAKTLFSDCWTMEPKKRPTFSQILERLNEAEKQTAVVVKIKDH